MADAEDPQEPQEGREEDEVRPRRRRSAFPHQHVVRIAMLLVMLVAMIALGRPCADGVARFMGGFDPPPDAAPRRQR